MFLYRDIQDKRDVLDVSCSSAPLVTYTFKHTLFHEKVILIQYIGSMSSAKELRLWNETQEDTSSSSMTY